MAFFTRAPRAISFDARFWPPLRSHAQTVDEIVAKNIQAKGG